MPSFGCRAVVSLSLAVASPAMAGHESTIATSAPSAAHVPAGTYVDFEILDPLNSKLSKPGDRFRIRTAVPVMLDGAVVIPEGAMGEGEVIHAARARAAGKAGELILAARFIEHQGQRLALRGFRFGQAGTNRAEDAILVGMIASPVALLVAGSDVDVPVGARGQAKLVAEIPFVLSTRGN